MSAIDKYGIIQAFVRREMEWKHMLRKFLLFLPVQIDCWSIIQIYDGNLE